MSPKEPPPSSLRTVRTETRSLAPPGGAGLARMMSAAFQTLYSVTMPANPKPLPASWARAVNKTVEARGRALPGV